MYSMTANANLTERKLPTVEADVHMEWVSFYRIKEKDTAFNFFK